MSDNLLIGKLGEQIAVRYLCDKGFSIRATHFTSHWGELDIIAQYKSTLVFVEVKTRVGDLRGKPYEAVTLHKIRSLRRCIDYYLLSNKADYMGLRLDVVSIILDANHQVVELKHFENVPTS
ncbi:YraN family protein [Candidatus Roizmanbacteria bacterium]|nr:YraN family protein [Candidatus Roizmanbacteria bacterium]